MNIAYFGTGSHTYDGKAPKSSRITSKITKINYRPQSGTCHVQYIILIIPPPSNAPATARKSIFLLPERYLTATESHLHASRTHADLTQLTSLRHVNSDVKLLSQHECKEKSFSLSRNVHLPAMTLHPGDGARTPAHANVWNDMEPPSTTSRRPFDCRI